VVAKIHHFELEIAPGSEPVHQPRHWFVGEATRSGAPGDHLNERRRCLV
jgi:hypothetical protein